LYYNSLSESASQAAREAIVRGEFAPPERSAWGPALYSGTAEESSEIANFVRATLTMNDPENVNIQIHWLDESHAVGDRVQVTLMYQYQSFIPLIFGKEGLSLQAVSTLRIAH
jgi:hypothetical protein